MATTSLPSNIPLHCDICPKKPDFSDVSHLLTHIASKGHLSTYYKFKVKASSDDTSRQLIQDYDTWYAQWSIEDLMSERLNLKERRKSKSRGNSATPAPIAQYHIPPGYPPFMNLAPYDHMVDPRLVPQAIKTETPSRSATPMHAPYLDPSTMQALHHPYGNPMAAWHPSYMFMPTRQDDDDDDSSQVSFIPGLRVPTKANTDATSVVDEEDNSELNKLKGVVWPGMDLFDAATADQRRKRNQKKDTSVVEQLEATSKAIEAMEHIYSPGGSFCRSRQISGLPDPDDSPLPGEESPERPQKTQRAPRRKPLIEKDPNTARKPAGKPQKRGRPASNKATTTTRSKAAEQTKGKSTASAHSRKRKKSDDCEGEFTFEKPAEMNTLNSSFRPSMAHQGSEPGLSAPTMFRPNEPTYAMSQAYYPYQGYYTNPFVLEQPILPPWDFYSQDTSSSLVNPLFLGAEQTSADAEDDEQTVSMPDSDQ